MGQNQSVKDFKESSVVASGTATFEDCADPTTLIERKCQVIGGNQWPGTRNAVLIRGGHIRRNPRNPHALLCDAPPAAPAAQIDWRATKGMFNNSGVYETHGHVVLEVEERKATFSFDPVHLFQVPHPTEENPE